MISAREGPTECWRGSGENDLLAATAAEEPLCVSQQQRAGRQASRTALLCIDQQECGCEEQAAEPTQPLKLPSEPELG